VSAGLVHSRLILSAACCYFFTPRQHSGMAMPGTVLEGDADDNMFSTTVLMLCLFQFIFVKAVYLSWLI
jgi:hypothetical protein